MVQLVKLIAQRLKGRFNYKPGEFELNPSDARSTLGCIH
jgi:hypothetical protein